MDGTDGPTEGHQADRARIGRVTDALSSGMKVMLSGRPSLVPAMIVCLGLVLVVAGGILAGW